MDWVHLVSKVLLIIAGINLGIYAVWDVNVMAMILHYPWLDKVFNVLVGLAAVFSIYCFTCHRECRACTCHCKKEQP
jgi:uncharacterized membrane protein YuzA (DUF378 family)